jgi:hypothetical protein
MKHIIKAILNAIESLYNIVKQSYLDTWSDEILADELSNRVKEIQDENKAKYIGFAAGIYTHEASKRGKYLPERTAFRMAHKSFINSVLNNELDELYNVKGEGNETE